MNAPYKPISDSAAEDRALAYYVGKIDARVAKMAKKDLPEWTHKGDDLWIRNFTCERQVSVKKTRFPDVLKCPKFRETVAVRTCQAFRRYGWEVDSYIWPRRYLYLEGFKTKDDLPVGSGYELRVKIKALPAALEKIFRKVHGTGV